MEIAKQLGKFSGGEADDLRKAMGKLYRIKGGTAARDYMKQYEEKWFDGCRINEIPDDVAQEIWDGLLGFGNYGYNKSHSASYALQAYQDMYLKIKYPGEFYAAFLTYEDDEDKRKAALREARMRGIDIALPDINTSDVGYRVDEEGRLQLGLTSISGMGEKAAKLAIELRPFTDIDDFIRRSTNLPVRQLTEAGALDSLAERKFLLSTVPYERKSGTEYRSVWEHMRHNNKLKTAREIPPVVVEPEDDEMTRMQAEILGLSHLLTQHVRRGAGKNQDLFLVTRGHR